MQNDVASVVEKKRIQDIALSKKIKDNEEYLKIQEVFSFIKYTLIVHMCF